MQQPAAGLALAIVLATANRSAAWTRARVGCWKVRSGRRCCDWPSETIGIATAIFPTTWLSLFVDDPTMLAVGSLYLRVVGPFYGFFGAGLALCFASQGAGRLGWPLIASALRLLVATAGGWLALRLSGTIAGVFAALGLALAVFGVVNAAAIMAGAWSNQDIGK